MKPQYVSELNIPYGYCHCGCGQKTPIANRNRIERGIVKGQPLKFLAKHGNRLDDAYNLTSFWMQITITADDNKCWEWQGHCDKNGYGKFRYEGKLRRCHQIAWSHPDYVISDGLWILHSCDNPTCCNPKHLFLGTAKDNAVDRMLKGRNADQWGENNPNHRSKKHKTIANCERCGGIGYIAIRNGDDSVDCPECSEIPIP